jgi:predicted Zn-dependent protease
MKIFDELIASQPDNRAVRLSLAQILIESDEKADAQRAQAALRPLLSKTGDDPVFHQTFARASELAGDRNRAAESYAEYAYYTGRPEDALNQLNELLKRKDLDYVQRARVESSIAILMPIVLEMRKQGVRPSDQDAPRLGIHFH